MLPFRCVVLIFGGVTAGGLQLTTTVATHFYLNLPIANCHAYNQRPIQPVEFPSNVPTSNVPTSNVLKTDEINITTIPDFYQHLANGVNVGTEFIISSMVIGIDLYNDWKFIQCPTCCHKVDWANVHYYCKECKKNVTNPRQTYKLVITIGTQDDEEINCVLFNTIANQLLGYTVEELLTKSIKEGADVPYWLDDFFVDKLIGRSIVLRIKIDKYNLAPTFVRRYTATKYYGDTVDVVKEKFGMILPSKVDSVNSKITDEDERMMDEIQWGSACGSTTPIPKIAVEVPLSTVNEVRAPNMESSKGGFENGIKCETTTTIIDTFEGSPARATMTNEDNPSDTHTDSATSHAYNDAVYVRSEALKEADTKEFDTKEVLMMEVDMKECDMRQVDVKEVVMDEEDTKKSYVKKDNMKQVDVKEAVMDEEQI
ncbi:replication factor A protein 1 [Tanacetum coccineum]